MFRTAAIALAAGLMLTGCHGTARTGGGRPAFRGHVLGTPLSKPEFTLTATDGKPFDFRRETDGYLTLVYFGYTHCPDICPVHMANLGAVIPQFPPSVSDRIKVIFITTDPARDSLTVLRRWLDNFDRNFIGLRGPIDSVNAIQRAMGLPEAVVEQRDSSGGYTVGHSATVVAFTPDNKERVLYPFGTRQDDWAHDLPKLLKAWPHS